MHRNQETESINQINELSNKKTTPSNPEAKPTKTEAEPINQKTAPNNTEAEPSKTKIEPSKTEDEPSKTEDEPSKAEVEPRKAKVEPGKAKVEPGKAKVEPGKANMEPSKAEVEPCKAKVEPSKAEVNPSKAGAEPRIAQNTECGVTLLEKNSTKLDSVLSNPARTEKEDCAKESKSMSITNKVYGSVNNDLCEDFKTTDKNKLERNVETCESERIIQTSRISNKDTPCNSMIKHKNLCSAGEKSSSSISPSSSFVFTKNLKPFNLEKASNCVDVSPSTTPPTTPPLPFPAFSSGDNKLSNKNTIIGPLEPASPKLPNALSDDDDDAGTLDDNFLKSLSIKTNASFLPELKGSRLNEAGKQCKPSLSSISKPTTKYNDKTKVTSEKNTEASDSKKCLKIEDAKKQKVSVKEHVKEAYSKAQGKNSSKYNLIDKASKGDSKLTPEEKRKCETKIESHDSVKKQNKSSKYSKSEKKDKDYSKKRSSSSVGRSEVGMPSSKRVKITEKDSLDRKVEDNKEKNVISTYQSQKSSSNKMLDKMAHDRKYNDGKQNPETKKEKYRKRETHACSLSGKDRQSSKTSSSMSTDSSKKKNESSSSSFEGKSKEILDFGQKSSEKSGVSSSRSTSSNQAMHSGSFRSVSQERKIDQNHSDSNNKAGPLAAKSKDPNLLDFSHNKAGLLEDKSKKTSLVDVSSNKGDPLEAKSKNANLVDVGHNKAGPLEAKSKDPNLVDVSHNKSGSLENKSKKTSLVDVAHNKAGPLEDKSKKTSLVDVSSNKGDPLEAKSKNANLVDVSLKDSPDKLSVEAHASSNVSFADSTKTLVPFPDENIRKSAIEINVSSSNHTESPEKQVFVNNEESNQTCVEGKKNISSVNNKCVELKIPIQCLMPSSDARVKPSPSYLKRLTRAKSQIARKSTRPAFLRQKVPHIIKQGNSAIEERNVTSDSKTTENQINILTPSDESNVLSADFSESGTDESNIIQSDPSSDLVITSVIGSVSMPEKDCSSSSISSPDTFSLADMVTAKNSNGTDLVCAWCRSVWNPYILNSLFKSACAVTVKSRITFGAVHLMNIWAINEKLPSREMAIYHLLERADLSQHLLAKQMSLLLKWIEVKLEKKERKCCDVFSIAYFDDKLLSIELQMLENLEGDKSKSAKGRGSPSNARNNSSSLRNVEKRKGKKGRISLKSNVSCSKPPVSHSKPPVSHSKPPVSYSKPPVSCSKPPKDLGINSHLIKSFAANKSKASHKTCKPDVSKELELAESKYNIGIPEIKQQLYFGSKFCNGEIIAGSYHSNDSIRVSGEYSQLSVDVRTVYLYMPMEPVGVIKKGVTIREVCALHSICMVQCPVPMPSLLYKALVQILSVREYVLLVPDSSTMAKIVEKIRKQFIRKCSNSQSLQEYLEQGFDPSMSFSSNLLSMKESHTLQYLLTSFCYWKNRNLIYSKSTPQKMSLQQFLSMKEISLENITSPLSFCISIFDKYCFYAFVKNDLQRSSMFLSRPLTACLEASKYQTYYTALLKMNNKKAKIENILEEVGLSESNGGTSKRSPAEKGLGNSCASETENGTVLTASGEKLSSIASHYKLLTSVTDWLKCHSRAIMSELNNSS